MVLILLWGSICRSLYIETLSPTHWLSTAAVVYHDNFNPDHPYANITRPIYCKFENVYADMVRVYFIARSEQAVEDLHSCCLESKQGKASTTGRCQSVHHTFCQCFRNQKYVPAAWTKEVESLTSSSVVLDYTNKTTWLMNHWCAGKHIDHFNMKIMEMFGYIGLKKYLKSKKQPLGTLEHLPDSIDAAVSLDYVIKNLTNYEQMILDITKIGIGNDFEYSTLNDNVWARDGFLHYGMVSTSASLSPYCLIYKNRTSTTRIRHNETSHLFSRCTRLRSELAEMKGTSISKVENFGFVSTRLAKFPNAVFISPNYKNNIPEPTHVSRELVHEAFLNYTAMGYVSPTLIREFPCPPPTLSRNSSNRPRIAIIQRSEGLGMRTFVNFDEVVRLIQASFHVPDVHLWYIDSRTPAAMQALMFCSAHVVISPHSSQLSNVMFSRPGTAVIEIRPPGFVETSFEALSKKMGHNYHLLNEGNQPAFRNGTVIEHGPHVPNSVWYDWNTLVNCGELQKLLSVIAEDIYK